MQSLVLVGAGQGLVSIIHLPVVLNHVTNLDLNGLILYDLANVGALISEHVRTLALVDCSIIVRITTALPLEDLEIHYMHHTIHGLNRYELSLRWSHIFSFIAASRIRHFSFGSTQLIDGCKVFVSGINPDSHDRYKAYDSNKLLACPFDLATFETSYQDAVALTKLWHSKGDTSKAVEVFYEYEGYPGFLQLAGPELVQEMKNTRIHA